jgi:hypothetical protein
MLWWIVDKGSIRHIVLVGGGGKWNHNYAGGKATDRQTVVSSLLNKATVADKQTQGLLQGHKQIRDCRKFRSSFFWSVIIVNIFVTNVGWGTASIVYRQSPWKVGGKKWKRLSRDSANKGKIWSQHAGYSLSANRGRGLKQKLSASRLSFK